MIWKVYAQNVVRPKGMAIIGMNSDEEFEEELEKAVMDFLDVFDYSSFEDSEGDFLDPDQTLNNIYIAVFELFEEHWNKYKYLDMGDYILIESDEMPSRPNKCGCSTSLFSVEDVRKRLDSKTTRKKAMKILQDMYTKDFDITDITIKILEQINEC